jgi:hypothetical protein
MRRETMQRNVVHKISDAKKPHREKPWRDEKVFIYFSPRGTARFSGHPTPGDWIVADGRKPVSPGQEIVWQVVGTPHKLQLDLPAAFEDLVVQGNTASATVKGDAVPGLVLYDVYVDGQLAIGGSSPGVIIDP